MPSRGLTPPPLPDTPAPAPEDGRLRALLRTAHASGAVAGSFLWDIASDRFACDPGLVRLVPAAAEATGGAASLGALAAAIRAEDRAGYAAALDAARHGGGAWRCEVRLRQGAGTRWIELVGEVGRGDDGAAAYCAAVLLDITARKQTDAATRRSQERFFQAINTAASATGALIQAHDWSPTPLGPVGEWPGTLRSALGICLNAGFPVCIYWGPEYILLYNDAWSSIPGDKHPWALGRPAREAWADIWPIIGPMFDGIRNTGVAVHTVDGLLPMQRHGYVEECYFNYNVSPIYGEDGRVAGLFNSVIETTYRLIAERRATLLQALRDATAGTRSAAAACARAAAAIASDPADLPFCLLYLVEPGSAARAVLAGAAGLAPGGPASPEAPDLGAPDAFWPLAEAYHGQSPVLVERLAERLGAPLVLDPWPEPLSAAWVAPIADPGRPGVPVGLLVAGISPRRALDDAYRAFLASVAGHLAAGIADARAAEQERRATEELEARVAERTAALARAQEALVQSQKMEAVGQLTGGLAHDFNNLLTGITGSLDLLRARVAQGRLDSLERYIVAAQGAAGRAAALTHRLLAFSRRQTLDPKPTNVNRLIAGLEELLRRTIGPGVTVEVVAAGGLWSTLADPQQLENALLNLCINARDAMPEGGRLTIETANRWLDQRAARDRDLPPGQYISLCVTDTGAGMAPDVMRRAFDPFFTTKPLGQGTGLGLSMVYGFARQSGGQVQLYSEPGHGTSACLYLPRHHAEIEEEAAPPGAGSPQPASMRHETVLVVDDEPSVRMLVREVLEDLGYAALEAPDAAAGLRLLDSDMRIDLLITDVGLPGGMNGRQLADAARARRPRLRVLFITGYAENAVVGNGHLEAGMHVLTKPFAMEALASRVRDLVGGA